MLNLVLCHPPGGGVRFPAPSELEKALLGLLGWYRQREQQTASADMALWGNPGLSPGTLGAAPHQESLVVVTPAVQLTAMVVWSDFHHTF